MRATTVPSPALRRVLRPILRRYLRLSVEGLEHLPEGPFILASTHTSHGDSVALGTAADRPLRFLGDRRLTSWRLLGPLLPALGMVPLARGQADTDALDELVALLKDGEAVVVYPEGSRSRDGRVYKPRSGVARLAAVTGALVVPAAVLGAARWWPVDRRPVLLPPRITVRFGAPVPAPVDRPADRRAFSHELHDVLIELSGAPRAETFAPLAA